MIKVSLAYYIVYYEDTSKLPFFLQILKLHLESIAQLEVSYESVKDLMPIEN